MQRYASLKERHKNNGNNKVSSIARNMRQFTSSLLPAAHNGTASTDRSSPETWDQNHHWPNSKRSEWSYTP